METGPVSDKYIHRLSLLCQSPGRDQEEGGVLDSQRRDREQGGGAGLRKLDCFLLRLFLNSCATDIVLVTAPLCHCPISGNSK